MNKVLFLYKGYKFLQICAPNCLQKLEDFGIVLNSLFISETSLFEFFSSTKIGLLFNFKNTSSKEVLPMV